MGGVRTCIVARRQGVLQGGLHLLHARQRGLQRLQRAR